MKREEEGSTMRQFCRSGHRIQYARLSILAKEDELTETGKWSGCLEWTDCLDPKNNVVGHRVRQLSVASTYVKHFEGSVFPHSMTLPLRYQGDGIGCTIAKSGTWVFTLLLPQDEEVCQGSKSAE